VAERAQVGIGTLYRHFPDQQSLLKAVVRHTLVRSIEAGETALASAPDSFEALRQYMHAAIDNGIGVVNLIHPLLKERRNDLRGRAESLIRALIARGRRDGALRPDTAPADVVFATIRFGRPLGVGLSGADEKALAHRHLDIYLEGLRGRTTPPMDQSRRKSRR
jgi:AcrR family transcriptional regulator